MQQQADGDSFHWTKKELTVLSETQIGICSMIINGSSDEDIINKYGLKSKGNIVTCIKSTISGNIWSPGASHGGAPCFLSDVEQCSFIEAINQRGADLDCIRTIEAVHIAYNLREYRYVRSQEISLKLQRQSSPSKAVQRLIRSLEPYVPSSSWLTHFCESRDIKLKNSINLEEARRKHCNYRTVSSFYLLHRHLFLSTHPSLIWNADETSSESTRKYKVLMGNNIDTPISSSSKYSNRITTVLSINALGEKIDPFVIVPNLTQLPNELSEFNFTIASQKNGWMTKKLWSAFCVMFVHKIQLKRMEMSTEDSKKFALLIVDNHISRLNSYAIEYLIRHKIHLLTLPPHSTHVLQPIDVSVTASFKSNLNKAKISVQNTPKLATLPTQAAKIRYSLLLSIQKSWNMITSETIKAGFEKTGIYPFNPFKGIQNKFTNPSTNIYNSQNQTFNFSNKLLTSDTNRILIANKYYNIDIDSTEKIPIPLYNLVKPFFTTGNLSDGFILNKLPSLFINTYNGVYVKIVE